MKFIKSIKSKLYYHVIFIDSYLILEVLILIDEIYSRKIGLC